MADKPKRGRGRPRTEFDLAEVKSLGVVHCSYEEMASLLGVGIATIHRHMEDEDSEFRKAYKNGQSKGRRNLRSKQFELAFAGDKTMLIWLGKQYLGQADKQETDTTHHAGETIIKIMKGVDDI